MLLEQAFKLAEPITLFTDGLLGVQCMIFAISLLIKRKKAKNERSLLIWIWGMASLSIFAYSGATSHFTPNYSIYKYSWPMTVIFGGLALFFFDIGIIDFTRNLTETSSNKKMSKGTIVASIFIVLYIILLIVLDWPFMLFGVFLVLFCIHFLILFQANKSHEEKRAFLILMRNFLIMVLVLGIIQVIGKAIPWNYYYGEQDQYLLQAGNEVFHLGILYPNYLLYKGIVNEFIQK